MANGLIFDDPLKRVQAGTQFVNGLFDQQAQIQAGRAAQQGNYTGAAGLLDSRGLYDQSEGLIKRQRDMETIATRKKALTSVAAGDYKGALTTAAQAGDTQLFGAAQDAQAGVAKRAQSEQEQKAEYLGRAAYSLSKVPPEQRHDAFVSHVAPTLKAMGVGDDVISQISHADLSDEALQSFQASALGLKESKTLDETHAKNTAEAANKETDNKRLDATAAEDARHHHALEGLQARTAARLESGGGAGIEDGLTNDTVQQLAETVVAGGQLPALGMGKAATAARQQILNRVGEIRKAGGIDGYQAAESTATYKANSASLTKLVTQRQATEGFESTASKNADLALSLAPKGASKTNVPVLNKWIQSGRKNVGGDPDVAAFDHAIGTFADEYAKVVSGSMGNSPLSDSARNEMYRRINGAMTQDQLKRVIDVAKTEMKNRTASQKEEEATARSALSNHPGKTAAPAGAKRSDADLLAKYGIK